ncbi:hypothetical protein JOC55_004279 [Paenibacillus sacheonensis]|nr:hypothetical protein [Paenibacillus sacheonensis]
MYIAAFLFPLDNFPHMFGGAYKPLSLIFIAIYLAMNIKVVFTIKYRALEIWIAVIIASALLISAFQNLKYHYRFTGWEDAVSSLVAGIVIYLAFKVFVHQNKHDESYIMLFKWIIRGYSVAIFVGLLQLVYIYGSSSDGLAAVIKLFVTRDPFIGNHRVHFSFSEPSFIGLHTNLLLFPAYIILKNKNRLSKFEKLIVFSFVPLTIFSLSVRYFLDLVIFYVIYTFATTQVREIWSVGIKMILTAAVFASLIYMVFVQNVFKIDSDHYSRISHIFENPENIATDDSFAIRFTYSVIGVSSFLDKPVLGYGMGNYNYGYVNHLDKIPVNQYKPGKELYEASESTSLSQYNMYTRLLSELGMMGIFILLSFVIFIRSFKGRNYSKMMAALLGCALLQFDSFAFIQMYFWIAFMQSGFISQFKVVKTAALSEALVKEEKYPLSLEKKVRYE